MMGSFFGPGGRFHLEEGWSFFKKIKKMGKRKMKQMKVDILFFVFSSERNITLQIRIILDNQVSELM